MIFGLYSVSSAQTKLAKYCEIMVSERSKNRGYIRLAVGQIDSLFRFQDSTIRSKLNRVNTISTVPDMMNYMSSLGWSLLTVTNVGPDDMYSLRFFFKREFDRSELSDK